MSIYFYLCLIFHHRGFLLCGPAAFQVQERKNGNMTYKYECCLDKKCYCPLEAHIKIENSLVTLEFKGHHKTSHKGLVNTHITYVQKKAPETIVAQIHFVEPKLHDAQRKIWTRIQKFHRE